MTPGSEKTFVINELATGCCSLRPLHFDFPWCSKDVHGVLQLIVTVRFFQRTRSSDVQRDPLTAGQNRHIKWYISMRSFPAPHCCWGAGARWETWHSTRFQGVGIMLSDLTVRQAKATGKPCTLADTDGLSLFVPATGAKAWHFRFSWGGKRDRMSFGTYPGSAPGAWIGVDAHSFMRQI